MDGAYGQDCRAKLAIAFRATSDYHLIGCKIIKGKLLWQVAHLTSG